MDLTTTPVPSRLVIFFIFGATGDLTSRKLIPALYNLFLEKWMPVNFAIIGMGRTAHTDENFRLLLFEKLKSDSRSDKASDGRWNEFARHIHYQSSEISDDNTYAAQLEWIRKLASEWNEDPCLIYYMAVAPRFFGTIAERLAHHKLTANPDRSRVVIEKPFGHDLESARALNKLLSSVFSERQIYRIDHYLGKKTVQNIQAFRFANSILEPVWNRNYIDHVQISATEPPGIEGRGEYYEEAGALRDMVQNHILQLLCLVAMEPPVNFTADEVRNRKADVLNAARKFRPENISKNAVRAQYVPHQIFPEKAVEGWEQNRLIISIQPEMSIRLKLQAKRPGLNMTLNAVDLIFDYSGTYKEKSPEAYETLLLDTMLGDQTHFMRGDQVAAAWQLLMPILKAWNGKESLGFPNYSPDSWGPELAESLISKDGFHWFSLPLDDNR